MRAILVLLSVISVNVFANETIAGWKPTQGISEQQALKIAREAIHQDIGVDEDGQVCGGDEMWGWEREADLKADFPQERGEIFAITGYVTGPHSKQACSGTQTYDCRVVFNRPRTNALWKAEYTECEPTHRGPQE
jgi:hypothetical protein